MSIYQIGVGFQGTNGHLQGQHVTARGLHGVLYHVLKTYNSRQASWLHQHQAPKPYTLAPYFDTERGTLAGVRLNVLTDEAASLLASGWEHAFQQGATLSLGKQRFRVTDTTSVPGPSYNALAALPPTHEVTLQFLSPTCYRQGPGFMPLPIPANVFRTAFHAWEAFAPRPLQSPGDWLDWCAENVFVTAHQIETITVPLSRNRADFTGFVGTVTFTARSKSILYLSFWHALAQLAAYTGSGAKTTMGMGAVGLVT